MSVISNVVFEQNPPANLRKSNFFNFVCRLFDANNQVLGISSAVCVGFIDHNKGTKVLRNGVRYRLRLITAEGLEVDDDICAVIVDSETHEIVPFQGQDRNPSMTRVLLTHESICSRCAAKKSCGNKNDTPADPVIQHRTFLKIFLKCNQNCLINAGNPRELRKFKLAISGTADLSGNIWAYSSHMFVHNNSKHGRVIKSRSSPDKSTDPSISIIWPQPGPVSGGRALIVGKNFIEDTHVLFGTTSLHSKVITPEAIQVDIPPATQAVVVVSLIQRNQLYQKGWHYTYSTQELTDNSTDFNISISPLNLSTSTRIAKPQPRQYAPSSTEQLSSFSSMLGISRDMQISNRHSISIPNSRASMPCSPVSRSHSPTYPPPPLKPIPLPVQNTDNENDEGQSSTKNKDQDQNPFSFSKEGSAFNRVRRDLSMSPRPSVSLTAFTAEEAETASILESLKTSATNLPIPLKLEKTRDQNHGI